MDVLREVMQMAPSADLQIQKDQDRREVKLQDLREMRVQGLQIQKVQDHQEVKLRDRQEENLQDLHQLKDQADQNQGQQGNRTLLLHRTIHHQEAEVQVVAMAAVAVVGLPDQAEAADN